MLKIDRLGVRYGGIVALRQVSIEVREAETVLLVGSNGAGKSSLINAVMGLVPAHAGSISLAGADLGRVSAAGRARLGIGYSPEGRKVFGSLSVTENVLAGATYLPRARVQENLGWMQTVFPLLSERGTQPAGQLSGGQQQIVALARAVSTMPRLLLLDEPFLGLAPVWIRHVSDAIRRLQDRGVTILMTEQMARPALKLAGRAYVMRGGEVRRSGTVAELGDVVLADEYL